MRYARRVFARAVSVGDALTCRKEGLPSDTGRIVNPRLLGFCITASGLALLNDIATGFPQPRVDLIQFIGILNLNAEMIEAGLSTSGRNRKIYAWVVEHPFGIVWFGYRGLSREQGVS